MNDRSSMKEQPTLWNQPPLASKTRDVAYAHVAQTERDVAKRSSSGLGHRQQQVFDLLRTVSDLTNMEIARALRIEINRVTPRVLELRAKGLVVEGRKRECRITGNTAQAWRAASR